MNIIAANDYAWKRSFMVETGRAAAFVMDDILLASLVAGSRDPRPAMQSRRRHFPIPNPMQSCSVATMRSSRNSQMTCDRRALQEPGDAGYLQQVVQPGHPAPRLELNVRLTRH